MFHFIQKIYYSFKYRKVLKDVHRENDTFYEVDMNREADVKGHDSPSVSESAASTIWTGIFITMLIGIPFAIGCGFGFVHYRNAQRISNQQAVDKHGIEVDATIESLKLEIVKHTDRRPVDGARRNTESRYCNIAIKYMVPNSNKLLRKHFQLEDDTICHRYQVGETIKAKLLPDKPEIIVLNEGRLSDFWYWISLWLCIFFIGLPILVVFRIIYVTLCEKLQVTRTNSELDH